MCGESDVCGSWNNAEEVLRMRELDYEGKKAHAKKLWKYGPKTYYDWKAWCIARNRLLDFGTRDDPILIDESKL